MIEFDDTTQDLVISNDRILLGGQPVPLPGETAATIQLIAPDTSLPLMSGISTTLAPDLIYTGNHQVRVSLTQGPDDMQISSRTGRLIWTPKAEHEGQDVQIQLFATDGIVNASVSFSVSIAQTYPVATIQSQEPDGRTRIQVTENIGNLKNLEIVLPQTISVNGQRIKSRLMQSQTDKTGVALIESAAVPENIPDNVIRLTDFFRIDPATTARNEWIEVVFPDLELPEGRYPFEMELFVFSKAIGTDNIPVWNSIDHGLDVTDDNRIRILISTAGSLCFIGIREQETEAQYHELPDQNLYATTTSSQILLENGENFDITCQKETFWGVSRNNIDVCTAIGNFGDTAHTFNFRIKGLNSTVLNNFAPNWEAEVSPSTLAGWLVDAIFKFEEFNLDYDKSDVNEDGYNIYVDIKKMDGLGYVSASTDFRTLNITSYKDQDSKLALPKVKGTVVHEYFHHAQARTGNVLDGDDYESRKWIYEGTARWFEDEVFDDLDTYILKSTDKDGFLYISDNTWNGLPTSSSSAYDRVYFPKFLQKNSSSEDIGCEFSAFLPAFFKEHLSLTPPDGAQRLVNLVEMENNPYDCNFNDPFGSGKNNTMAAGLDYYTWAMNIESNVRLIDENETNHYSHGAAPIFIKDDQNSDSQNHVLNPLSARVLQTVDWEDNSLLRLLRINVEGTQIKYAIRNQMKQLVHVGDSSSSLVYFSNFTGGNNQIDKWYITLINDHPTQTANVDMQIMSVSDTAETTNIQIQEPVNGSTSNNRVISLKGTAAGGNAHEVKVNISQMSFSTTLPVNDEEFSGMIPIANGINDISIIPIDPMGNEISLDQGSMNDVTVTGEEGHHGANALIESQMVFTLTWDQARDMDIHVWDPLGQRVWWSNRSVSYNGITYGQLDYDNISGFGPNMDNSPEVVTYFADLNRHPEMDGCFTVGLHYYSNDGPETNLILDILLNENHMHERRSYRKRISRLQPRSWSAPIHVHCRYNGPGTQMTCSDDPGIYNGGYCEVPDDYPTSTSTSASNLFLPSKY
jgi:hypothetical protein